MSSKNICKFTQPTLPDILIVSCFVMEANERVMTNKSTLNSNRMILVTEGSATLCFDGQELDTGVGTLVFGFTGEVFTAKNIKDATYIYIDFGGTRGSELLRRFDINKGNRVFGGFDGLIPMWSESLSRASENTVDLAAESILLYTFSRLTGANAEVNGILGKIIDYTEENFTSPTLSVSEIAKKLSYNPKYISHLFKEKMKISYSEYLRSLRIKYAITLFDHGIDSIKNVALLSGFSDPLYFSTVFKKEIGVSPKDYINSKKG
jgi:AraC-like DNA-binding protein